MHALFGPDPYFTNQSVNGFVSRLVRSSDRLGALVPGAFDPLPVVFVLTAALAFATLWILWRYRDRLDTPAAAAIAVAFVLVGATAGAPKTSFWNESLVLPAAGLLFPLALTVGNSGCSVLRGLLNIDEETQNLVKFQNAYGAAAHVITVLNQMLQTAIGLGT